MWLAKRAAWPRLLVFLGAVLLMGQMAAQTEVGGLTRSVSVECVCAWWARVVGVMCDRGQSPALDLDAWRAGGGA